MYGRSEKRPMMRWLDSSTVDDESYPMWIFPDLRGLQIGSDLRVFVPDLALKKSAHPSASKIDACFYKAVKRTCSLDHEAGLSNLYIKKCIRWFHRYHFSRYLDCVHHIKSASVCSKKKRRSKLRGAIWNASFPGCFQRKGIYTCNSSMVCSACHIANLHLHFTVFAKCQPLCDSSLRAWWLEVLEWQQTLDWPFGGSSLLPEICTSLRKR